MRINFDLNEQLTIKLAGVCEAIGVTPTTWCRMTCIKAIVNEPDPVVTKDASVKKKKRKCQHDWNLDGVCILCGAYCEDTSEYRQR